MVVLFRICGVYWFVDKVLVSYNRSVSGFVGGYRGRCRSSRGVDVVGRRLDWGGIFGEESFVLSFRIWCRIELGRFVGKGIWGVFWELYT